MVCTIHLKYYEILQFYFCCFSSVTFGHYNSWKAILFFITIRILTIRNMYFLSNNYIIFYMVESNLGILFFDFIPSAVVLKFKESNFPVAFQRYRLSEVSLVFSHYILRIIIDRAVAWKSHVKVCHVWLFCFRQCSITSDLLYWNGTCSPVLDFISISTASNFFYSNWYVHRVVIRLPHNFTLFRIYTD